MNLIKHRVCRQYRRDIERLEASLFNSEASHRKTLALIDSLNNEITLLRSRNKLLEKAWRRLRPYFEAVECVSELNRED